MPGGAHGTDPGAGDPAPLLWAMLPEPLPSLGCDTGHTLRRKGSLGRRGHTTEEATTLARQDGSGLLRRFCLFFRRRNSLKITCDLIIDMCDNVACYCLFFNLRAPDGWLGGPQTTPWCMLGPHGGRRRGTVFW